MPRGVFLDFPLGHTAGKKHDPLLQQSILLDALTAFEENRIPGEIKELPYRWSANENWREKPLGGGGKRNEQDASSDFRTSREPLPQYQTPEDEESFLRTHHDGACGTCVGAE